MFVKKKLKYFFILCFLQLLAYQNLFTQKAKAKLLSVTNQTEYDCYVEEILVDPGKTLSQSPLPKTIPSSLPGISISGMGAQVGEFQTGQVISLPPLLGQGCAWLDEEYSRSRVTIVFQAKAESGGLRILLSDNFTTNPVYTIVIGGNRNTRSSILKNGVEMAHVTREENPDAMVSIVEGQESAAYIPFWICFKEGLILVGKGWPGDNIFLSCRDANPNPYISKVAISSDERTVRYTNIILLPSLVTFPPSDMYQEITPKKESLEQQKITTPVYDNNILRYGGIVKITNTATGKGLQAYAGSSVVGADSSDWWIIKGPHGTPDSYKFGEQIPNGAIIRLQNLSTRKNLSFDKEVVVKDALGNGVTQDNWTINLVGENKNTFWQKTDKISLIQKQNNGYLFFDLGAARVKLVSQVGLNTEWQITAYSSPVTNKTLPTGSIIALKSQDAKYLSVNSADKNIASALKYQQAVYLQNQKEVINKNGQSVIDKRYLNAVGAQKVQGGSDSQGWFIRNYANPSSTNTVRYGDLVILQSSYGNYLGKSFTDQKLLPNFTTKNLNVSFMIIDPANPLNRGEVFKGNDVAFQSIDKAYISCLDPQSVDLKRYISSDEKWRVVGQKDESDLRKEFVFVGDNNISSQSFDSQFRVIRDAGTILLQSVANNEFLTAGKTSDYLTTQIQKDDASQKFLLRRIGSNYFLQSLFNLGVLNYKGSFLDEQGGVQGYKKGTNFKLEVLSKPEIEILEATYGTDTKVYDVTDVVQSLVRGSKLVIPAGQSSKVKLFGDPARGLAKKLKITYLDTASVNQNQKTIKEKTQIIPDNQEFVIGVKSELENTGVLNISGGLEGDYIWLPYNLRVDGRGTFIFKAQGASDIYVGFAAKTKEGVNIENPMYEIVIGAENDSKIILRKKHNSQQLASALIPNVITSGENKFWCSINNGVILVGKGELGEGILIAYKDMNPLNDLNVIGISNGANPIKCSSFQFAPPVTLGNPPNFVQEYQKKYQTFMESKRKLFFLFPFKYDVFHRDGRQIAIKDESGKITSVAATELQGRESYPFSATIGPNGAPEVMLEWMPPESKLRTGLKIGSAVLSSISGVVGSVPDPRAQAVAAAGGAISDLAQYVSEGVLGGQNEGVRTESYIRTLPETYSDPEVAQNTQSINVLMANIEQANPEIPEQFKYIIDAYRKIFLLIVSPDNVDNVLKDSIFRDIRKLLSVYKQHSSDLYNDLINTLFKAHNNRFLFTLKDDESKRKYIFNGINEIAKSLFKNKNTIEIEELLGEYLWLQQELPQQGNGAIMFQVDGEKDVFVAFSGRTGKIRDTPQVIPMYELIIGAKNNTASIFRLENKGYSIPDAIALGAEKPQAVLQLGKFKKYWFSIRTYKNTQDKTIAKLTFGHDEFIPKNILLEWEDKQPYKNIKYVGIGSWETLYTIKDIKVGPPLTQGDEKDFIPVFGGQGATAPKAPAFELPPLQETQKEVKEIKKAEQKNEASSLPPLDESILKEDSGTGKNAVKEEIQKQQKIELPPLE